MTDRQVIDLAAALLVSGHAASVLVQAVKDLVGTKTKRLLLAVMVSIAVGAAQAWISGALPRGGGLTAASLLTAAAAVFTGASAFYRLYFRPRTRRRPHRQRSSRPR